MHMPKVALSFAQREQLLDRLASALDAARAQPPNSQARRLLLGHIDRHLNCLIAIAQRLKTDRLEPCISFLLDDVCPTCQFQFASGYCPLRSVNGCLLYREAQIVFRTIRQAMPELGIAHSDIEQDVEASLV
jgi:hypothetical protein